MQEQPNGKSHVLEVESSFNIKSQHQFLTSNFNINFSKQLFIKEVRQHYNLTKPNSEKPTTVLFVVCILGKQIRISTKCKVYPKYWNGRRAIVNDNIPLLDSWNNKLLNDTLDLYDFRFNEYKSLSIGGMVQWNKECLINHIIGKRMVKKKHSINIIKTLRDYLFADINKRDSTKENNLRWLKRFEEYLKGKEISHYEQLNKMLMRDFQKWCISNIKGGNGRATASSKTINHIVNGVLAMIKDYLVENDLISNSQYVDMRGFAELKESNDSEDNHIALLDDEITCLYNYKAENTKEEQIKDMFLLECLTGQRISDLSKLNELIERKDGKTYITLKQDKGQKKVQADIIFQMALDIINKYDGRKLPKLSRHDINDNIKIIAKKAGVGIDENGNPIMELLVHEAANQTEKLEEQKERYNCISSHTGRRTFITLLSLRGYSDVDIAKYSGHGSLSMVRLYDKSKRGTILTNKFKQLQQLHAEVILKMVGNVHKENIENADNNLPLLLLEQRDKFRDEARVYKDEKDKLKQQVDEVEAKCKSQANLLQNYDDIFDEDDYMDKISNLAMQADQDDIFIHHEQP